MKIYVDTVGCRLNQAEIETIARQFRQAGHEIIPTAAGADLAVVNTCAVTAEAASDSRAAVRRAERLGAKKIVVTGCWATLEGSRASALPGVQTIVPNQQKDDLASDLLGLPKEFFDLEPLARQPLPGLHQRTRAFIKVQDGCDNACTYCITTLARGASHSRPIKNILTDIQAAREGGTKEIVLTGVQLGSWGQDLRPPLRLTELLVEMLSCINIPRLRLSSLEPWDLEENFFQLWSDPHLCRHLHLPLQSGSATVLRRMARKSTPEAFNSLLSKARAIIPDIAITTDLISGFPGETEDEFEETAEFVKVAGFSGGHVFPFSARPGTPAARIKGQVRSDIAKKRSAILRQVLSASSKAYRSKFIGKTLPVLWEGHTHPTSGGWQIEGLTDNYIRVLTTVSQPRWNRLEEVRLVDEGVDCLIGEIIE